MGFNMISEVGSALKDILVRELVPDVILHSDNIGMCSPEDHGDFNLGIYLYDIMESEEIPVSGMVNSGVRKQSYPSTFLTLYYMVTAYSSSDLKFRAEEEQKILGKVIQTFRDYSVLQEETLGDGASMPVRIELYRMERQVKMRMWNIPNVPYRLSLFYRVQPVEINSGRTREITRVQDVSVVIRDQSHLR